MRASSLFEQQDSRYDRICKDYVNLAVKYTPVSSNVTLSFLLCLRSKVEQRLGDYARALEDAKNALKMTPTMLEVNILNLTVHTATRWRIRHSLTLHYLKVALYTILQRFEYDICVNNVSAGDCLSHSTR